MENMINEMKAQAEKIRAQMETCRKAEKTAEAQVYQALEAKNRELYEAAFMQYDRNLRRARELDYALSNLQNAIGHLEAAM